MRTWGDCSTTAAREQGGPAGRRLIPGGGTGARHAGRAIKLFDLLPEAREAGLGGVAARSSAEVTATVIVGEELALFEGVAVGKPEARVAFKDWYPLLTINGPLINADHADESGSNSCWFCRAGWRVVRSTGGMWPRSRG